MIKPDHSPEYIRSLLDYDPESGIMVWKKGRRGGCKKGDVAGNKRKDGRWMIIVDFKHYLRSRLAWFHFYGKWPVADIDHKNLARDDDRIDNLREATRSQNLANREKKISNRSGYKGVSFDKSRGRWQSSISCDKKRKNLGRFNCPTAAYLAYCRAAKELHAEFARM
jgi:hypothetical protein